MKLKDLGLIALSGVLLLSGCNNSDDKKKDKNDGKETVAIREGDYTALLPFDVSDARLKHMTMVTNLNDTLEIANGLMKYSKQHFSPDTYTYRESQFLDYNTLDASADKNGLLGRKSEENPIGLNPENGTAFQTDKGTIKDPVILVDIFEIDWYKGEELSGLSLAMVVNSQDVDEKNQKYTIKESDMKKYESVYGQRLLQYMRDTYPQMKKLPIYVTVYDIAGDQEGIPGTFKREGYVKGDATSIDFSDINANWVLFPTDESDKKDATTNTAFVNYKKALAELDLGDDTSIIGKGYFENDSLNELKISVVAHAKTGMEMNAIAQLLVENLDEFATSYRITVDVSCDNNHYAAIEREKNSSKVTTILF
ncbi:MULTISPECIES: CamS family sex pheromone protein [Bacillota]|uniref:CamS family sex pheromone protein n=2 Tax=Amedibacillus TaxID=2749846 RepID=A0A7G9GK15_9FIRM|nr:MULTISPECIES: CamS family sex pheromone protein [Bacillota]MCH4284802.1 CamS family sex pheromone protein [Amedibacillus hominis]QNM11147.1 CamS family sex pheromone protein [[Eubacterium] hominis]RGB52633.1 CamS family sex pheromone protein [Absiella sp. AM22-9]RGB57106.1 CamS family sex pheromone protein [Absiella sp. AM10-20]RGB68043.1 CamS family sex pheromone protein [Absiella sp. AM09-45]